VSERARAVIANKSKSFALASRLLPRDVGDEVAVLYAYCRRADDEVDLAPPAEQPARVERLYAELTSIYAREPQSDPLLSEFQALIERRGIPEEYPRALLDGMRSDLGPVRLATLDELLLYSYRVAGVVGLMLCHVFGLRDRSAFRNAADLGIAMQLTNICRDVREDLARGRVYLPADVLATSGALRVGDFDSALVARAVERLLALADRYYRSGDAGLYALPLRAALAVRAARLVYSSIGDELAKRGFDALRGRTVVPRWKKFALVGRAVFEELGARLHARLFGRRRGLQTRPPVGIGAELSRADSASLR
jgi:15-cis-phytoene synthase